MSFSSVYVFLSVKEWEISPSFHYSVAETNASPHTHLHDSAGEGNKGGHQGSLPTYLSTTLYEIPKLSKIVPSLKDQSTLQENKKMTSE